MAVTNMKGAVHLGRVPVYLQLRVWAATLLIFQSIHLPEAIDLSVKKLLLVMREYEADFSAVVNQKERVGGRFESICWCVLSGDHFHCFATFVRIIFILSVASYLALPHL